MNFKMTTRKLIPKKPEQAALANAFKQEEETDAAVAAEVKKQMERAGRQTRWTIGRQVASKVETLNMNSHATSCNNTDMYMQHICTDEKMYASTDKQTEPLRHHQHSFQCL